MMPFYGLGTLILSDNPVPRPYAPYFTEPFLWSCLSPSRPLSKCPGTKNYLLKILNLLPGPAGPLFEFILLRWVRLVAPTLISAFLGARVARGYCLRGMVPAFGWTSLYICVKAS